ncbi:MAG: DUF72 domain-containing protein, partial [Actinobacteria bacterium]|nr:DUF72 domain-containing protein [Actinomycetota bacterium]
MREDRRRPVRIGCSGWNYAHWRNGVFYPPRCPARRWLEVYAESFDTVEVNATFYRLPRVDAVAHWVERTPDGFTFAVKASRYLTHVKRLRDLGPGLETFLERIEPLLRSPKLGPLLWQLPPTFRADHDRLADALAQLPAGLRNCFEFRDPSWFVPETYALLREHGVALVIGDRPQVNWFQTHELTTDWTFVRFHGGTRGRRGNYSEGELREWADRIRGWSATHEVFAYFNNDWEGFAPRNALRLKALLSA